MGLARLIEYKLNSQNPYSRANRFSNQTQAAIIALPQSATNPNSQPQNYISQPKANIRPIVPPTPTTPFHKLTPLEVQQRREKGSCFKCDDKFGPGHKYKNPDPLIDLLTPPNTKPEFLTITLLSFAGSTHNSTFRCTALINNKPLSTLIDSGSNHNFIHPSSLKGLNVQTLELSTFVVKVGNGQTLHTGGVLRAAPFLIQGTQFTTDLHILPIHGCDLVVGNVWLRSLGPVLTDHSQFTMSFVYGDKLQSIIGNSQQNIIPITTATLRNSLDSDLIIAFTMISLNPPPVTSTTNPSILKLLSQFPDIFETPTKLPPHRLHDHHIHLLQNSQPVNVRPYRYPQFQRTEITRLIKEMLNEGIIKPSTSPFSSPVLLVKKKDGSNSDI